MRHHSFSHTVSRGVRLGLSVIAIAATMPEMAWAADAVASDMPSAGTGDIIVTATRREERARDVPIAVSSISGEKLDTLNSSGLDIRFLSSRTPSLQIESSFGRTFPRFYIRGLGNTDYDPNAAQPVSVVYDDVALENPMLKSFPVFDLADVQVLRGPQGTLFGRNTPAGVIKLTSAKPTDTFGGFGSVEYGSYNTVNAEGALNVPLGGGFDARFSGLVQHRDNWVTNTAAGQPGVVANAKLEGYTDYAGRMQLAYASPDNEFHALLNLHGRGLNGTPRLFRAGLFQLGSNNFSAGFNPAQVQLDGYTSQSMSQTGASLHLDYHIEGLGTLYSVSAYEHAHVESTGDIDGGATYVGFPALGLNNALFPDNTGGVTSPTEFSQELRFATDDFHGLRLQAGVNVFHQILTYSEYDYAGPPYTTRLANLDQDIEHRDRNDNIGLFASGEYKIDKLTLRAGVRYSDDHKHDVITGYAPSFSLYPAYFSGQTTLGGEPIMTPQSMRVSGSFTTWDASATYAATPAINLYARAATGYQGPAIQDRVTFGSFQNSAPKQTTLSLEGGLKGSLFDHAVSFSIDGYYNETKNLQFTAVGGASNSARLVSAAKVLGNGFEGEVDMKPLAGLTISASGSYNFTKIKDPNLAVFPCGSGCTVLNPAGSVSGTVLVDGNPLPQAPKYVASLTARYEVPLPDGSRMFFMTDWAYRSSINYFLYAAKEFTGRSLTEGGVKVGYQTKSGLEVAFYGRNILNQIRAISAIDFNNFTGMINDPTIWGGSLRVPF